MFQPIGVVVASGIAYGTAAKWRCDPDLPSCKAVASGESCCTVSSNMGWRYNVIVLGCMTLAIFFLRYFVFSFQESPKFLLARGREADAIAVLHKIAKINKAPPPTLTLEMFAAVDEADSQHSSSNLMPSSGPQSRKETTKHVIKKFRNEIRRLKGIFTNKLSCFIFVLLGIAYMGDYWSFNLAGAFLPIILLRNNVDDGRGSVKDTYQQYIIIYTPGIMGAVLALASVQMPLLGRKWSLVLSAICQGLSMAMYTQVHNTAGFVGLNALEYIMQTVWLLSTAIIAYANISSTSTRFCMPLRRNSSILSIGEVLVGCSPASDVLPVLLPLMLELSILLRRVLGYYGSVPAVFGFPLSSWCSYPSR